jgi:hypothetical protein
MVREVQFSRIALRHTGRMQSGRVQWQGLILGACVTAFISVGGSIMGNYSSPTVPIIFAIISVGLTIGGIALRRVTKREEAELMATAAEDLEAEQTDN